MTLTQQQREASFWSRVDADGDCWLWVGPVNKLRGGYGIVSTGHKGQARAHRMAWELLVGPIPPGLKLDHRCRNPPCVNPDHLEPVTDAVNIRRGVAAAVTRRRRAAVTKCKRGHPFDESNTYIAPDGWRECKKCRRAAVDRYQSNNREASV